MWGAQALFRKLDNGSLLEPDDEHTLAKLVVATKSVPPGVDLFREGEDRRYIALIAEGWACHYKHLADGRRQIIGLLLAGDLCQPFGALPAQMTDSLAALAPLTVAYLSAKDLRDVCKDNPRIERALWWDLQFMKEAQSELVVSLGRRNAIERLAYLCSVLDQLTLESHSSAMISGIV